MRVSVCLSVCHASRHVVCSRVAISQSQITVSGPGNRVPNGYERCSFCSCFSFLSDFYKRVSIASYTSAGIARAEMSVCLSVCLSHSGIVSKRRKLVS